MIGFKQRNNSYSNCVFITLAPFWKREGRKAWKWGDQWRGREEFPKCSGALELCRDRELGVFEFSVEKENVDLATTLCMRKRKSYQDSCLSKCLDVGPRMQRLGMEKISLVGW